MNKLTKNWPIEGSINVIHRTFYRVWLLGPQKYPMFFREDLD